MLRVWQADSSVFMEYMYVYAIRISHMYETLRVPLPALYCPCSLTEGLSGLILGIGGD